MSRRIDWNRNQPIIHHLREVLPSVFPVLSTPGHGLHRSGIGGFNNRSTRFGTESFHATGCAGDIYLDANNTAENPIGDGLFNMFIKYAAELGVDHVIWNTQIWSVENGGPRLYGHGAHRDHVHVAFTEDGSQLRPTALSAYAKEARMAIVQSIRSRIAVGA